MTGAGVRQGFGKFHARLDSIRGVGCLQSLTAARQNVVYGGEQIDIINGEASGICRRQDTIRTPLHQGGEVVCQDLLRVDDE